MSLHFHERRGSGRIRFQERRPPRWLAALFVAWLAGSAALMVAIPFLGIWAIFAIPAWGLATLACAATSFAVGLSRLNSSALGLAALVPAAASALIFLGDPLHTLGLWLRFQGERDEDRQIVAAALAGRLPIEASGYGFSVRGAGRQVRLDSGPPTRIAIVWDQLADNWNGIVYDPSERVAERPGGAVADGIRELFGGDLVGCRRLEEAYYHCGFT